MKAGRNAITIKKDWNTPLKYVDTAISFFNKIGYDIELDPATNEKSLIPAKIKYILPYNNGLNETWNVKTIWLNPPFGRDITNKTSLKDWVKKAYETNLYHNTEILMLLPCSLNTSHFQNIIFNAKMGGIVFLNDTRLRFLDASNNNNEDKKGSPIGMCIVYFGKHYTIFNEIYKKYGKCFEIIN